jgi:hypothetical protein
LRLKIQKLSTWKKFDSKFVAPFEIIPFKMVAYNLYLPRKDMNFEGIEIHFLNFLRKYKNGES